MRQAYKAPKVMGWVKSMNLALRRTMVTAAHRHDGAIGTFIKSHFCCSMYQSDTTIVEQSFYTMINRPMLECDIMSVSYSLRFDVE